jgi:DNA-binding PadR family transcriptional regulator
MYDSNAHANQSTEQQTNDLDQRWPDADAVAAVGGPVVADGGQLTADATLRLTDDGIELPDWLQGHTGTFEIRTGDVSGEYETTDAGLPETQFYDAPFAVVPDAGDYNPHIPDGHMVITAPDEPEWCYEVVDERSDEPEAVTDGGVRPAHDGGDLTRFQFEILYRLANTPECADYGLGIKRKLEAYYEEEVNHGRLYPNLDTLVENGLLTKSELDKRTNEYALTDDGKTLLHERARRRSEAVGAFTEADSSLTDAEAAAVIEGVLTEVESALDETELDDLGQVIDHLRSDDSGEDIPVIAEEGDA